jgi:hypothetical protein
MGILAVYKVTVGEVERLQWYEGTITSVPDRSAKRTRKGGMHGIFWVSDGKYTKQLLAPSLYSTNPASGVGSWFLFGTKEQCERLMLPTTQ